jgi:HD-like signal output (HDOD) protein
MTSALESRLERILSRVGDLPAMPATAAEVLRLADDPDTDMNQIGDALQRDPGLTAKILRVSNSSYYGMRQYVGTLRLALVILGVREIRNIVLGVSLFESLRDDATESVLKQDFWSHSFSAASVCKELGSKLKLKLQGEDFIAGLLHDIGKLVLCRQLGDKYAKLYRKANGDQGRVLILEKEELGLTHADAGAALCAKWNLPKTLSDSIWFHHPAEEIKLAAAKDPQLAAVVRVANLALHDNLTAPDDSADSMACSDAEAWEVLQFAPAPIAMDERRLFLTDVIRDVNSKPPLVF